MLKVDPYGHIGRPDDPTGSRYILWLATTGLQSELVLDLRRGERVLCLNAARAPWAGNRPSVRLV